MIRRKWHSAIRRLGIEARKSNERKYPKVNFALKHIANCKMLIDRIDLLKILPKEACIAEIGVFKGDYTSEVLKHCEPSKYYLIDIWGSNRYNEGHYEFIQSNFKSQISLGTIEIIRALSFDGIQQLPEAGMDWVYLDTDHSLETTRKELSLLLPKMKKNGIIAGHDYIQGSWVNGVRYGVIEAVREFCVENDWELIYLTHELDNNPSFAIRAINSKFL